MVLSIRFVCNSAVLARNLTVYDYDVHERIERLPFMMFQQYVSPTVSTPATHFRAGCLLGCLDEVQLMKPDAEQEVCCEQNWINPCSSAALLH